MSIIKVLEQQFTNQAVGTLTLGRRQRFREIFFDRDEVYIVGSEFAGKVDLDSILASDALMKRVNRANLETLLVSTDFKRTLFPQVLFDQGLLGQDELEPLARAQLLEEILNLLCCDDLSFHFQEERVPECLLECEGIQARAPVPLESVLQEIARRLDMMSEFSHLIPSCEEVFVVTERGMAHKQRETDDLARQRLFDLVDGLRDFATILNDAPLFGYHVYAWAAESLEQGFLKKTIHPELKGISTTNLTKTSAARYLPLFKNAVRYGVDELAARERLAVLYEKLDRREDAIIQYNFIGDSLFQMRKPAQATKAYQRALKLKPGEALLTDKIIKIYREAAEQEAHQQNVDGVIQFLQGALKLKPNDRDLATRLMTVFLQTKRLEQAEEFCDQLAADASQTREPGTAVHVTQLAAKKHPTNTGIRKRLINLHLDFGMLAEACAEMETLARQYQARGHADKAAELTSKIRRLKSRGSPHPTGRRSQSSIKVSKRSGRKRNPSKVRSPSRVKQQPKPMRSGLWMAKLAAIVLLVVGLAYQFWAFMSWQRLSSDKGIVRALTKAEGQPASKIAKEVSGMERKSLVVLPNSREARFRSFMRRCEEFATKFPLSFFRPQARRLCDTARKHVEVFSGFRDKRKKEVLENARVVWRQTENIEAVQEELLPLWELPPDDEFRSKAENLLKAFRAKDFRLEVQAKLGRAKKLEKMGEYSTAYKIKRDLLKTGKVEIQFSLPVVVKTIPSGAIVRRRNGARLGSVLGKTPCPVWCPAGDLVGLEISHQGFESIETVLDAVRVGPQAVFPLNRDAARTFTTSEVIDKAAEIQGESLVWATQSGKLVHTNIRSGVETVFANEDISLSSAPLYLGTNVYTRWSNSEISRYSPVPGDTRKANSFRAGRLISTPLSLHPHGSRLVFGAGRKVITLRVPHLDRRQTFTIGSTPTALWSYNKDRVIVGEADGTVSCLRITGGLTLLWSTRAGRLPVSKVGVVGGVAVALSGNLQKPSRHVDRATGENYQPRLTLLNALEGDVLHSVELSRIQAVCLHQELGKIYFWDQEQGLTSVDPRRHKVHPERDKELENITRVVSRPVWALRPVQRGIAIVHGAQGNVVYMVDPHKGAEWTLTTQAPIKTVVSGGYWVAILQAHQVDVFPRSLPKR